MSWFQLPKFLSSAVEDKKNVDFKIHIAIDFGTHGCALAYAYKGKVYPHTKWGSIKPLNNIILNAANECVHFGSNASLQLCN